MKWYSDPLCRRKGSPEATAPELVLHFGRQSAMDQLLPASPAPPPQSRPPQARALSWPDVTDACPQRHLHLHCFYIPAPFSSTFWAEKEQLVLAPDCGSKCLVPGSWLGPL